MRTWGPVHDILLPVLLAAFAIIAIVAPQAATAQAVAPNLLTETQFGDTPFEAYLDGNIVQAIALSRAAAAATNDPSDKSLLLFNVAYYCSAIFDADCLADATNEQAREEARRPGGIRQDVRLQTSVWILHSLLATGDIEAADRWAASLPQVPMHAFNQLTYLVLQETLARLAQTRDDDVAVRRAASRLIVRVLNDPGMSARTRALYLASVVTLMYASGDSANAHRFVVAFEPYILANLGLRSLEVARYFRQSALSYADAGDLDGAIRRMEGARLATALLRIPENLQRAWQSEISNYEVVFALATNDPDAAAVAHARSPYFERFDDIVNRGRLDSIDEAFAAVTHLFLAQVTGDVPDARFVPLFAAPLDFSLIGIGPEFFEPYRRFANGLLAPTEGRDGLPDFVAAARIWLDRGHARQRDLSNLYPVPDVIERIGVSWAIVQLAAQGISGDQPDDEQQNLVLSGLDYLQRTARQTRGDALALLSALPDAMDRRLAQSYLQLSTRQSALELEGIATAISATPQDLNRRTNTGASISLLAAERDRLRASHVDSLGTSGDVADIVTIRSQLEPNEALVTDVALFGGLYKLCVTRNVFLLVGNRTNAEMVQQANADIRILRAALGATHAPSEILDSQYPVAAALRMREFLLGGLEPCLSNVTRFSYVPLSDVTDLPLQALLEEAPPRNDTGYDLAAAKWLLHRYEISYLSSIRDFTSTGRLAQNTSGALSFLGVGDPVLGQTGDLAALGELPETGTELAAIRRFLPGARLLTRAEATEARVREEPLGAFNVLSFATHGLMRGEIDGIDEPGLVLSQFPVAPNTPAEDGFLSASELAAMALNARLVVLSGCNTAGLDLGLFVPQVRGLAEALAVAGVPTVLASLWSVDSETTQRLMTAFFAEVAAEPSRSLTASFSGAVRDFVRNPPAPAFRHPRFWAAFVMLGAGGSSVVPPDRADQTPRLISIERGTDEGGEVLDLVTMANGDIIVSRAGEWDGTRFASILERRGTNGLIRWQIGDRDIGAGKIALSENTIYATGYSTSDNGATFVPLLRAFDLEGTALWQWSAPPLAIADAQLPALTIDSDHRAIALAKTPRPDRPGHDFVLLRFNADGSAEELSRLPPMEGTAIGRDAFLERNEEGLFVLLNRISERIEARGVNDYGLPQVCLGTTDTLVFFTATTDAPPQLLGTVPQLVTADVQTIDGHIYAAGGKSNACNENTRSAWFGELNPSGVRALYAEPELPRSRFTDIAVLENRIVLLGDWVRQHGARQLVADGAVPSPIELLRQNPTFELRELFVTAIERAETSELAADRMLDIEGHLTIGTGTTTIPHEIHGADGRVTIWASVGSTPLTAEIAW